MSKSQKTPTARFLGSLLLALLVYLALLALLSLLTVHAVVSESWTFPLVSLCGGGTALLCGLLCAKCFPMGTMPNALLSAASFGGLLILLGLLIWQEGVVWTGQGGICLLSILMGGVLAGLFGGRKRGKRVRRR